MLDVATIAALGAFTVAAVLASGVGGVAMFSVSGSARTPSPMSALREFVRRNQPKRAKTVAPSRLPEYVATLFDSQVDVLDCWDEFVAVLCTRRAGKTTMVPAKLFRAAERHPGSVIYYVHPDGRSRARETLVGPDINAKRIADDYGLGWRFNENQNTFFHRETGSEIRLRGADDLREAKKLRGDKVCLVVLEECQNFPANILRALVEDILGPALADVGGQMLLIGTAGEVCSGYWYDVTRNEDANSRAKRLPGWRVFEWSALDNPHMMKEERGYQAPKAIARKLTRYTDRTLEQLTQLLLQGEAGRRVVEAIASADPSVMREWFGRWVNDSGALFYRFDAKRNVYDGILPNGHVWRYVAAFDLGTDDAFALHVWAFADTHDKLYEVESYSISGEHAGQWRGRVEATIKRWNPVLSVVDAGALGKGIVLEWRQVYGIPVEPAEKSDKYATVSTLNGALMEGNVQVLASPCGARPDVPAGHLAKEWAALRKDPKSEPGKPPREDPSQPNHCADAALYGFRAALRLMGKADKPDATPPKGTPERIAHDMAKREEELSARMERLARGEDWNDY